MIRVERRRRAIAAKARDDDLVPAQIESRDVEGAGCQPVSRRWAAVTKCYLRLFYSQEYLPFRSGWGYALCMLRFTRRRMIAGLLAASATFSRARAATLIERRGELLWRPQLAPETSVTGLAAFSDGSLVAWTTRFIDDPVGLEHALWRVSSSGQPIWSQSLLPGDAPDLAAARGRFGRSGGHLWGPGDDLMTTARLVRGMDFYPLVPEVTITPQNGNGGEDIVCGDALLGLWRVSGDGAILWHHFPDQPLGLSVMTSMDAGPSDDVLVGGTGLLAGHRCEVATVTSINHENTPSWRWQFTGSPWTTFAVRVLSLDEGAAVVLIASATGNRNLSGLPHSPCLGEEPLPHWLAWLRPDGSLHRLESLETEGIPFALARFPTGEVMTVGAKRFADSAVFRVYAPDDGKLLNQFRLDPKRDLGAEPGLSFWHVEPLGADGDNLILSIHWYCLPHSGYCPSSIRILANVSRDGAVRLNPIDTEEFGWPQTVCPGTRLLLALHSRPAWEVRRFPLP